MVVCQSVRSVIYHTLDFYLKFWYNLFRGQTNSNRAHLLPLQVARAKDGMSKNGEQRRNDDGYDINRKKCNRSSTARRTLFLFFFFHLFFSLYFSPTYYFFTFLNDYLTSSISLPLKTIKKFDIIYIQGKERCLRRCGCYATTNFGPGLRSNPTPNLPKNRPASQAKRRL